MVLYINPNTEYNENTEKKDVEELIKFSDPNKVVKYAEYYLGHNIKVYRSNKPSKKYSIINPDTGKHIYFGQMGYTDYTLHNDEKRRNNYLKRTEKIKGNWKNNLYSPNNLSRIILWNANNY